MNRRAEERTKRFARELEAWSETPPRRTPREAADRLRARLAATEGGRSRPAVPPARWLLWTLSGAAAAVALIASLRPFVAAPPAEPYRAVDPVAASAPSPDTVIVHELSSGTRVYVTLPVAAPR